MPILVAAGMITLVKLVQPLKAPPPMVVATGKLTLVKLVQEPKADSPILIILSIVMASEAEEYATNSVAFLTRAFPPSITLNCPLPVRIKLVKLKHPIKGLPIMLAAA